MSFSRKVLNGGGWETAQQMAFKKLKKQVCDEPILLQPDQNKPFEIEVNASNYAISAMLIMQMEDKGVLHSVAFFLKTTCTVATLG
jgi:hypothetical protein